MLRILQSNCIIMDRQRVAFPAIWRNWTQTLPGNLVSHQPSNLGSKLSGVVTYHPYTHRVLALKPGEVPKRNLDVCYGSFFSGV